MGRLSVRAGWVVAVMSAGVTGLAVVLPSGVVPTTGQARAAAASDKAAGTAVPDPAGKAPPKPSASPAPKPAAPRPVGLDKRVPWTTSRVVGTPEPPPPFRTVDPWPALARMNEPLDGAFAPGVPDRLWVAERWGKLLTHSVADGTTETKVALDLNPPVPGSTKRPPDAKEIYGFTFHPDYAANGHVFVVYNEKRPRPCRNRISRFTRSAKDPLVLDPGSEVSILEWITEGHNGACLKFGPDGKLHISTGDGSGINDEWNTGQNLDDLLCCILRIDVDNPPPGRTYTIPKDNPFVEIPGARGEIWAYGLRNPWRMSFDRAGNGDLWCCDVGQDLWEMVYLIKRGGNYGWSAREGTSVFRENRPRGGPSPFEPPVVEHPHSEARSLTGGYVYRGKKHADLAGHYIYGDYETGLIWALQRGADGRVASHRLIADTPLKIIAFVEDPAGELYVMSFDGRTHRLEPAPPPAPDTPPFPRKLSETGLFADVGRHVPAPGVLPYDVVSPLWSDGAHKERMVAVPGEGKLTPDWQPMSAFTFPDGSVLVKTFALPTKAGDPSSVKRIETRIMVNQHDHWRGYSYRWNDAGTDAELVGRGGVNIEWNIAAGPGGAGGKQTWRIPSRAECTLCHTMPPKFVLGFNPLQLDREFDYSSVGGRKGNQMATLEALGYLTRKPSYDKPGNSKIKLKMVAPDDKSAPLDDRAKSYLHANCAHCHVRWGGGQGTFQFRYGMTVDEMGILDYAPEHGAFGVAGAKLLLPGDPDRSMMLQRMKRLGQGRMPHVASSVVDPLGVALIEEWIRTMPSDAGKEPRTK